MIILLSPAAGDGFPFEALSQHIRGVSLRFSPAVSHSSLRHDNKLAQASWKSTAHLFACFCPWLGRKTVMGKLVSLLTITAIGICGGFSAEFDLLIRNGRIYNGSGSAPFNGDLGIKGDTIAAVGPLKEARATTEIDAQGLAVAPGFINMLSWATQSLIED